YRAAICRPVWLPARAARIHVVSYSAFACCIVAVAGPYSPLPGRFPSLGLVGPTCCPQNPPGCRSPDGGPCHLPGVRRGVESAVMVSSRAHDLDGVGHPWNPRSLAGAVRGLL